MTMALLQNVAQHRRNPPFVGKNCDFAVHDPPNRIPAAMTPPVETAAPVEAAIPPSPSLMPYPSTFSEEEIHDILGAMNSNDNDGDDTGISADSRAKARSERKRSREKQRREDVNKHFGDLSQLLRHIETEDEDGSKWVPATTVGPTNRVDLIARTIIVMERIHKVNMDRKQEIVDLNKQLEDAKKMAEDTAARLKEATMYQQGPQKQVCLCSSWSLLSFATTSTNTCPLAGYDDGTYDGQP